MVGGIHIFYKVIRDFPDAKEERPFLCGRHELLPCAMFPTDFMKW